MNGVYKTHFPISTQKRNECRARGAFRSGVRSFFENISRFFRGCLLLGFDAAVLVAHRPQPKQEGAIFCLHGLGDLLLAGNAITALSANIRSRGLKCVLFVQPPWVDFARLYFDVDAVEGIDRHRFTRKFKYRAKILKAVAGRFAVAMQPAYNRMFRVEDCLMRITGAREKIGSAGHRPFISPAERRLGDLFYDRVIPAAPGPIHELERYAEFLRNVELTGSLRPWMLNIEKSSAFSLQLPGSPYLVLAPQASDIRRSWPIENFLHVARDIAGRHGWRVVVVGNKSDFLQNGIDADKRSDWIDLIGKVPTEHLPKVLAGARLVLSNDSGIHHLAVSLSRPAIAVGGSGLPERYFPYPDSGEVSGKVVYKPVPCAGCNWRCIHTVSRNETAWCLQQVSWQEVAQAANELLQQTT